MNKPKEKTQGDVERRTKIERRQRDKGPPKKSLERRRHPDRRLADVEEILFSDEEWKKLFGGMVKKTAYVARIDSSRGARNLLYPV